MRLESILLSAGVTNLDTATKDTGVSFGIDGYLRYKVFGHEVWLTTTHICLLLIMATLIVFAIVANRVIKNADPNKVPGPFLNIIEYLVETFDNMTKTNMGNEHGYKFSNYIGTIFIFILFANISGLFGLRSPTADYGVTLGLGLMTFCIIHYNGFKYQKSKHVTNLFKPIFLSLIHI